MSATWREKGSDTQKPPPPESVRIGDEGFERCRHRPTLPRSLDRSTIGAAWLNDRVRDGNGCGPSALDASDFSAHLRAKSVLRVHRFSKPRGRLWASRTLTNGSGSDLGGFVAEARAHDVRMLCECCVGVAWSPEKPGGSQAARAIRTAALGTPRGASTCCLSTE